MKPAIRIALCLLISVFFCEFTIRITGLLSTNSEAVEKRYAVTDESIPMAAPRQNDVEIGWVNRPGRHELRLASGDPYIAVNLADGTRISSQTPHQGSKIVLLGDSFTWGAGLADNQSLGWKLQESLPDNQVINYGNPGYGTCQTYLLFSRIVKSGLLKGSTFIYGLSSFHEDRSVATPAHTFDIAMASMTHSSHYPSCQLNKIGELEIYPPREMANWLTCRKYSALCEFTLRAYLYVISRNLLRTKRTVTIRLIEKMKNLAESQSAELVVLAQDLSESELEAYQSALLALNIKLVDGTPSLNLPAARFADGHPNANTVARWAEILSPVLAAHVQQNH